MKEERAGSVLWLLLVEVFLENGKEVSDFFGATEVGYGVGDGIAVFEFSGAGAVWRASWCLRCDLPGADDDAG